MWRSLIKNYLFFATALFFFSHTSALAFWQESSRNMMGTVVSLKLESQTQAQGDLCSQQAYAEMARIERLLSTFKTDSEVSKINRLAAQQPVKISPETFELIKRSLAQSVLSNGAFDITYASIGYKYDLRKKSKPDDATIHSLLKAINFRHIELNYPYIKFNHPQVKINLGGIGKGYAIESASRLLKKCGIFEAIISAGGDSKIIGDKHGKEWVIGIQHPRKKNELALRIPLSNIALSTSGDYERYYIDNGERIHHIINPATGKPSNKTWSASVIGEDATITDALSTAIFILGKIKGLELINSLDGFDAIIIDSDGKINYSNGLDPYVQR